MNKKVLGGVSALAIGVVGTGVYLAVPASAGSPQAEPAAASSQQAKQGKQAKQGQKAKQARKRRVGVHGDATVRTKKGFVQVTWQRGVLTSTSGGTLSVRSLDGTTWQWKTAKATKFRKDGQKSAAAKLASNDYVLVMGRSSGGTRTANRVIVPKKVPAKATQSPAPAHS
ncbi:hypothetical protein GCM10027176_29790 [Actinoallomurus bryophytorum]|uniref:DUF5666 domain-containing protein n=1 Tax=Actinoallomurus bryophytorum TaxID=1490222 RepID=A0A543CGL9_9ACTN|nr:hypothetical protein [Actinoallomurus bryophytorum]TQL96160.1 hypothetical protein FB559_1682 [Actinoallomurus bryophytorum]